VVLKKGDFEFEKILDDVGVPFSCLRCHPYGHMAMDYSLPHRNKQWARKIPILVNSKVEGSKKLDHTPEGMVDI
jgi:hypothetical protein